MSYRKILISVLALVFLPLASVAGNSLADYQPGFYLGGQLGYVQTSFSNSQKVNQSKIGGRAFFGYSFLPYLGLESGFTYFPSADYQIYEYVQRSKVDSWVAIDLMAKGILPLEHMSPQFVG